jgi:hypothetical protein
MWWSGNSAMMHLQCSDALHWRGGKIQMQLSFPT